LGFGVLAIHCVVVAVEFSNSKLETPNSELDRNAGEHLPRSGHFTDHQLTDLSSEDAGHTAHFLR